MFGIQPSRDQTLSLPLPACRIPPMRFLAALMRQAGLARQLEEISDFSTLTAFVGNDRAAQISHIPRRVYPLNSSEMAQGRPAALLTRRGYKQASLKQGNLDVIRNHAPRRKRLSDQ